MKKSLITITLLTLVMVCSGQLSDKQLSNYNLADSISYNKDTTGIYLWSNHKIIDSLTIMICHAIQPLEYYPEEIKLPRGIYAIDRNVYLDTAALLEDGWSLPIGTHYNDTIYFVHPIFAPAEPIKNLPDYKPELDSGWVMPFGDTDKISTGDIYTLDIDSNKVYGPDPQWKKISTERQKDTVPVIMLVCDTSYTQMTTLATDVSNRNIKYNFLDYQCGVKWQHGYSVREKHNEAEGLLDPYMCGNCVYKDYWQHLYYLDENKKKLKSSIIVWMSQSIK